jgi:tetratricopeptide (TPR) repeat protein
MAEDYRKNFNGIKDYLTPAVEESLEGFIPTPLKSYKTEFNNRMNQIEDSFQKGAERIANAWIVITSRLGNIEVADLDDAMDALSDVEEMEEIMADGVSFQEVFGITNEQMLDFYEVGLALDREKFLSDAADVFYLLCALNAQVESFWIALGCVEWKLEHYQDALIAYTTAMLRNEDNYETQLNVAQCMAKLGHPQDAKEVVTDLLEEIKDKPEAVETFTRATAFNAML